MGYKLVVEMTPSYTQRESELERSVHAEHKSLGGWQIQHFLCGSFFSPPVAILKQAD